MGRKISIQCEVKDWKSGLYFLWVDDYDDDYTASIADAVMNMVELLETGHIARGK